jgi:hypothetical protein
VDRLEWKNFIDELRGQWKLLWRDRIDDKVRAEGIADKDYSSLFVNRGTVIVATRDCKPPDFVEILEKHKPTEVDNVVPPNPFVGGWGKFARTMLSRQKRFSRRGRPAIPKPERDKNQQRKKGGRGWLHLKME